MFIVWGKKRVQRRLGFVADFCPLCRDVRTFEFNRIGMAGHVYYVSVGEGELVGYERTCTECDIALNGQPDRYVEMHPRKLPARELAKITFPAWRDHYANRLEIEATIEHGNAMIAPDVRAALMEEPFALISPKVESRFGATHLDGPTLLAVVAMFIIGAISAAIAEKIPGDPGTIVLALGWSAGIALVIWQVTQISPRFFAKKIFPALVKALLPLKPELREIEAVLKKFANRGEKIGKKLDANKLMQALQAHQ